MLRSRKNAGISTLGTSLYVMDKPAPAPDAGAECKALGEIIDRIADKWAVMVVGHLSQTGTMRFNELIRAIPGVSHRMLTLTLRALQRDGIVSRTPYATIPPRVDYALTPLGQSLTGAAVDTRRMGARASAYN